MKKYEKPHTWTCSVVFLDELAIPGDPGGSTSMNLGKERDNDLGDDEEREWVMQHMAEDAANDNNPLW